MADPNRPWFESLVSEITSLDLSGVPPPIREIPPDKIVFDHRSLTSTGCGLGSLWPRPHSRPAVWSSGGWGPSRRAVAEGQLLLDEDERLHGKRRRRQLEFFPNYTLKLSERYPL